MTLVANGAFFVVAEFHETLDEGTLMKQTIGQHGGRNFIQCWTVAEVMAAG
jgi:hypothetical protein